MHANFQLGWCPHLSFWAVPSGWPCTTSPPDEPCKQAVSTHLAVLCRRSAPHSSDVGPSLIAHSKRTCWKLETISPSALTPQPPAMQCYHLPTVSNPRLLLSPPQDPHSKQKRAGNVVSRAGRSLPYQQWKTDEISFGAGQAPCYMFELQP